MLLSIKILIIKNSSYEIYFRSNNILSLNSKLNSLYLEHKFCVKSCEKLIQFIDNYQNYQKFFNILEKVTHIWKIWILRKISYEYNVNRKYPWNVERAMFTNKICTMKEI